MSILAGVAFVEILPDLKKFAGRLTKDMTSRRAAFTAGGVIVGGAIVAGIASSLKAGLSDALKEQVSQAALANSLANAKKAALQTGDAFGVTANAVSKLADEVEAQTGIADDAVIASASWLSTFHNLTRNQPTFDRAQRAVVDLASKMAIAKGTTADLGGAQNVLGKALQDPARGVTALNRVGVTFTKQQQAVIKKLVETGDVAKAQELILKEVEGQVKGAGKAYGETLPGKIDRAQAAWGNAREELAVKLLPALTDIAEAGLKVTKWFEKNPKAVMALAVVFGVLAAAMITASIASAALVIASSPIIAIGFAIVVALGLLAAAFVWAWHHSETFRNVVTGVFNTVKAIVAGAVGFVTAHWRPILAILTGPIGTAVILIASHWSSIKAGASAAIGFIKAKWDSFIGFFKAIPGKLASAGADMWSFLKSGFKAAINSVIGMWNGLAIPSFKADPLGKLGPSISTPRIDFPNIGLLARGGGLGPGQLALVGENGPEFAIGGMRGATISPMSGNRAGSMAMTITNWEEGTGYITHIADGAVASDAANRRRGQRMRR